MDMLVFVSNMCMTTQTKPTHIRISADADILLLLRI